MSQDKSTRKIQVKVVFKNLKTQAKVGFFDRTFEGSKADNESVDYLKLVRDLQARSCTESVGKKYDRSRFNKFCEKHGANIISMYSNEVTKKPIYQELINANNLGISVEIINNY